MSDKSSTIAICECNGAGHCPRRGVTVAGVHQKLCAAGHVREIDRLYKTQHRHRGTEPKDNKRRMARRPSARQRRRPARKARKSRATRSACLAGSALKEMLASGEVTKKLFGISIPIKARPGCECNRKAKEMDRRGCDWCDQNIETVVEWLKEGAAERFWMRPIVKATGKKIDDAAREIVKEAIQRALEKERRKREARRKQQEPHKDKKRKRRSGDRYSTVQRAREKERRKREARRKQQKQTGDTLRRPKNYPHPPSPSKQNKNAPPVERIPFTREPARNLIYHIYPRADSECWQWNIDQLLPYIHLFNGKRIVAVVTDNTTVKAEQVKEYMGDDFTYLFLQNTKKGELATFGELLKHVETDDPDTITFRAHAKGVTKPRKAPILDWTQILYRSCLEPIREIEQQLEKKAMTGPCRKRTKLGSAWWFYSGAFYWFRNVHIYRRNWRSVQNKRWGPEAWPGSMFGVDDTGCIFLDNCNSMYSTKYWRDTVAPSFEKWCRERNLPGHHPVRFGTNQWFSRYLGGQPQASLDKLFSIVCDRPSNIWKHCPTLKYLSSQSDVVCELGTRYGVSTVALLAGRPKRLIAVDRKRQKNVDHLERIAGETEFQFLEQDSREVDLPECDLLFIDTRHTYEQLRDELKRHHSKAKRWIAFHDTESCGEVGEDGGWGLRHAIRRFLKAHPEWRVLQDRKENSGMLVLERTC